MVMRIAVVMVVVTLFLGVAATVFSNPADAGTKPVLTVGPGVADSGCVGDMTTPVCTVETWLACFARHDAELCALAAPHVNIQFDPEVKPHLIEYQISAVLTLTHERITKSLAAFRMGPGDVEIRLRRHECLYRQGNCYIDSTVKESYFLKLGNGNWIVVAWTDEKAPERCGDLEGMNDRYFRWCRNYIFNAKEPWVHDGKVGSEME